VLGPAAAVVGALQAAQAIRLLANPLDKEIEQLIWLDVWSGRFRSSSIASAKREDCIACGQRALEFLDAGDRGGLTSLCGRNAVQVRPPQAVRIDLKSLAAKLSACGSTQQTPYLVRCHLPPPQDLKLTIFPDGRMIVQNTEDLDRARSVYARWVGA
jgi:adenylyltransferase/sulfurtransferase